MDDPDLPHEGSGTKVPFENSGHSNDAAGVVGLSTQQGDKDSGDSQFYILLAPAKFLDGNYTVFGKVVEGLDVLKAIEKGDVVSTVTITHSKN
jgi:cyclophilin family peptidyl-prolyl cis-trans isomerase